MIVNEPIPLPKAAPRMNDDPSRTRCVVRLPVELHAALKRLARARRLTLSELMTAAGEALVRQYDQQPS